jgi:hypothetical protein
LVLDYLSWMLGAGIVALIVSIGLVVRNWKIYNLPLRLLPADLLTVILLIDLNIKSNDNITVDDPIMKLEAIAFTALLTFVLFAPVLWRIVLDRQKTRTRQDAIPS